VLSKASLNSKVTSAIFSLDCFIEQLCINTTGMLCTIQKSQCGDVMDAAAGIRWWAARCLEGIVFVTTVTTGPWSLGGAVTL
jgi:hypothetical protein